MIKAQEIALLRKPIGMKNTAVIVLLACIGMVISCDYNRNHIDVEENDDQRDLIIYIQNSDTAKLSLVAHYFDLIKGKRISDTLEFAEDGAASISIPSVLNNTYRNLYLELNGRFGWSILMEDDLKLVVDYGLLIDSTQSSSELDASFFIGKDSAINSLVNIYWNNEERFSFAALIKEIRSSKTDSALTTHLNVALKVKDSVLKVNENNNSEFNSYLSSMINSSLYNATEINYWRRIEEPADSILSLFESAEQFNLLSNSIERYRVLNFMNSALAYQKKVDFLYSELNRENVEKSAIQAHFVHLVNAKKLGNEINEEALREAFSVCAEAYKYQLEALELKFLQNRLKGFDSLKQDLIKFIHAPNNLVERYRFFQEFDSIFKSQEFRTLAAQVITELEDEALLIEQKLSQFESGFARESLGLKVADLDFGASLFLNESASVDSLLDQIKNHSQANYILIDVWGTWCGPCKRDMAKSHQIKKELKKLGVDVFYLSTEGFGDQAKWKQVITELEAAGTHILLSGQLSKKLAKEWAINSYPSLFLLDKANNTFAEIDEYNISEFVIEEFAREFLN
jgi:thiol-disulfide isomerase/thioredoxin